MKNPIAQSIEALARRVDAMETQRTEDAVALAHYSMLCDALHNVTCMLIAGADPSDMDAAEAHGVSECIRLACAILADASPPHRKWATTTAGQWAAPASKKRKAGKAR